MSDDDIALDEKRVFEGRRTTSTVFVASDLGLARVAVSDDQIGRFGLVHRGETRDVAVGPRDDVSVVVASDEDVLVGGSDVLDDADGGFEPTGFRGDAVAVSMADDPVAAGPLAADADSRISRFEGGEWIAVGTVDSPVVAMDGDLVATAKGITRIADGLGSIGGELDGAVRDVAAAGPFAATDRGLHGLVDGEWTREATGDATAVASDGERAVAVVDGTVVQRTDGDWQAVDSPGGDRTDGTATSEIVGLAVGHSTYAVTADGTILVDPPTAKDGSAGWATRSLGLPGTRALAVLEGDA